MTRVWSPAILIDSQDGTHCAAVAISWKLRATEGALGRAEEQAGRQQPVENSPTGSNLFGNLLPDVAPHSTMR